MIKKDAGHGPKHYLDEKELKAKVLIELVRKINSHYKKLLFHSAFWTESKTGVKRYFLNVRGEGSLYCLNKGDDHGTSTVYFVISMMVISIFFALSIYLMRELTSQMSIL